MDLSFYTHYIQDCIDANDLFEYIVKLIRINNNDIFLESTYKDILSHFRNPDADTLEALGWSLSPLIPKRVYDAVGKLPKWPLMLHGVVISSKKFDSMRSSIVAVDAEAFERCGSTDAERLYYIDSHRNTCDLLYAYSYVDNVTIGKVSCINPGTRIYISLSNPTINDNNPRMIMGEIVDAIYDDGDGICVYNDDINSLHGKQDYINLYNTYRERILNYMSSHNIQSVDKLPSNVPDIIIYGSKNNISQKDETFIGALSAMASEIHAIYEEEKRQEYLQNKSKLDPSKSREDYERLQEETTQHYRDSNKSYIKLLDEYIANGTDEEKGHASILKKDETLSIWLYLLLFVTGGGAIAALTGAEHFLTVVIWVGILIAHIAYICRIKKMARLAREFFTTNDPRVVNLRNKSEQAFESNHQAREQFETYQKVEKYERNHK